MKILRQIIKTGNGHFLPHRSQFPSTTTLYTLFGPIIAVKCVKSSIIWEFWEAHIYFYLWLYSPLLDLGRFFSFLIFYAVGKTP
jgi:hypothetical protein